MKGKRVDLPIKTLLGGIGEVRAHFYASFHSGRPAANPISRQTLENITGLSPRTQRDYDRLANVKRQRNIAVGPKHTQTSRRGDVLAAGQGGLFVCRQSGPAGPKKPRIPGLAAA